MTPLGKTIRDSILQAGMMPVSQYMKTCLTHGEHGYYTTRSPIGAAGDFTTAPEISQMFGEMIGVWVLQCWQNQGAPNKFVLAELGPGRGTLMADILRVVSADAAFKTAMQICLIETSPILRKMQAAALKDQEITYVEDVNALPDLPIFLVANEFFDAMPVQQFVSTDIGWQERMVDYVDGEFCFALAKPAKDPALADRYPDLANGIIVERSNKSEEIAAQIGQKINDFGGSALLIDYGDLSGIGDTFQAVKDHTSCDPLRFQGQCDLTCHVQFQPLAEAANCADFFTSQGVFLENMGITARANALADGRSDTQIEALMTSHQRLVHPDQMGTLFKVMALCPVGTKQMTGFEQ